MTQDELLGLIDQAAAENWTTIDLAGKGLSELPPEIGKLTNLKTLVLGRWDKKKGISGEAIGNNLSTLPGEILQLKELRSLFLVGNQFTEFPESICNLRKLKSLHLGRNQIEKLPESIGQLKELKLPGWLTKKCCRRLYCFEHRD